MRVQGQYRLEPVTAIQLVPVAVPWHLCLPMLLYKSYIFPSRSWRSPYCNTLAALFVLHCGLSVCGWPGKRLMTTPISLALSPQTLLVQSRFTIFGSCTTAFLLCKGIQWLEISAGWVWTPIQPLHQQCPSPFQEILPHTSPSALKTS